MTREEGCRTGVMCDSPFVLCEKVFIHFYVAGSLHLVQIRITSSDYKNKGVVHTNDISRKCPSRPGRLTYEGIFGILKEVMRLKGRVYIYELW